MFHWMVNLMQTSRTCKAAGVFFWSQNWFQFFRRCFGGFSLFDSSHNTGLIDVLLKDQLSAGVWTRKTQKVKQTQTFNITTQKQCWTCERWCAGASGCVWAGKGTSTSLMGKKNLKVIILLFTKATDVDIWAHLHHHTVSCSNYTQQNRLNRRFVLLFTNVTNK